jgi:DNA processing protein
MLSSSQAQELGYWIRLVETPGVGNQTGRKLLAAFGSPQAVFEADFHALAQWVAPRIADALATPVTAALQAQIDKTLEWANQSGNQMLTLGDGCYPKTLLDISDPPLVLYAKGCTDLLNAPAVAVVGSRNATAQGLINAEKFSEALSEAGLTIISGLALGIDTSAHQGGLRGRGSTVAVIGTGADIVYPARNRELAHRIAETGCILSEYALGTSAVAANFPRRNRIISGLAQGVLVVEAAARSGSLITARMAGDQGRDVFAIPGSIHSPLAKGCHLLIKQGAKLVESAQDILEELTHFAPALPEISVSAVEREEEADAAGAPECAVLSALGFDPVHVDTLAERCNMGIAELQSALLNHELNGMVEMLPGSIVRRVATS